jgi:hypothetical protein
VTPVATLSASAMAVIASLGTKDLRLRTTLRRDDVHVWTSWLPVQGFYETTIDAPEALLDAIRETTARTDTRRDATLMHEVMIAITRHALRVAA